MRHAMELFEPAFQDHEEAHAETMRHRELDVIEALDECKAKGVSIEALRTLVYETGVRWTPKDEEPNARATTASVG